MAAIFGGIVGQEVVKAATGKFHPIHQARATHLTYILTVAEVTRSYFLQKFHPIHQARDTPEATVH